MKPKQPEQMQDQEKLRQLLDQHSNSYDAQTLSTLRQAREKALLAMDKKPVWFAPPLVAAFASVCLLTLGVFLFSNSVLIGSTESSLTANDILLDDSAATVFLSNEVDIDFYEDIEFYEWLDNADAG